MHALWPSALAAQQALLAEHRQRGGVLGRVPADDETLLALFAATLGWGPAQRYLDDARVNEVKIVGRRIRVQEAGKPFVTAPEAFNSTDEVQSRALLLASVGLYGSLAHAVARRTREIGVRLACGADPRKMIAMVLREATIVAAIGLALGLPLAIAVGNTLRAFLFGVQPTDVATLTASCIVLTLVALVAAYVPARRASRIDPIAALRHR